MIFQVSLKLLAAICLTLIGSAQALAGVTCKVVHSKAISSCSAHENAINADALSIVSTQTRQRVIRSEETKLQNLKQGCLKAQEQCSLSCDEELESASIDGSDITAPLDKLNDCRQGEVARQIKAMDKKLVQLRRVMSPKELRQNIKSAANR